MICYRLIKIDAHIDPKFGIVTKEKFSWFYEPDFHVSSVSMNFVFREFHIRFKHIDG